MPSDPIFRDATAANRRADAAARADAWRAGCLDEPQARAFEQEMAADPGLARHAAFGKELAHSLQRLPELARRRTQRASRARRLRWPRVLGAGMAFAALAGLSFGLLPTLLGAPDATGAHGSLQQIQATPQMADAVQNLDFYEWLASHPAALQPGDGHGDAA